MPSADKKQRKGKKKKRQTMAQRSDPHDLYERAVQDPKTDAKTLAKFYRQFRGKKPASLREDFCGTAALSVARIMARYGVRRTPDSRSSRSSATRRSPIPLSGPSSE